MPPKKKAESSYAKKLGAGNPKPKPRKRDLTKAETDVLSKLRKGGEPVSKINKMKAFLKANKGCIIDAKKHADK